MNSFVLAAAFFAFHLLPAYLVEQTAIHPASMISSAVSIVLVATSLRLVVGIGSAAVEAGVREGSRAHPSPSAPS
jgi:hypothetical protein